MIEHDMEQASNTPSEEEIIAQAGPQDGIQVPDALHERIELRMRKVDRAEELLQEAIQAAALALEVPQGYQYDGQTARFVPSEDSE